jgi:hypothetical protein
MEDGGWMYKTRFFGALQLWKKRGFEGAAPSVSPTHIAK